MKKRVLLFSIIILSLIIILPLVLAAEGDEVDNAYDCLKTQLGSNCGNTNSVEQLSFSLLAMGYDSATQLSCKNALISKKSNDNWGDNDIKLTAQATLALDYISEDVDVYVDWLKSKRKLTEDLNWFLQIDADNATECQIRRDNGSERDFNIRGNKIVSGSSSCLDPASSEQNYYYEIDEDCLDSTFTISCDENFVSSVFYKKPGSQVYYISSESHSSTAGGETKEKVSSYCFARSSNADCDYEDSVWAALTLAELGESITSYLPYISSEADENENKKYLPSAFLYMFTGDDDYYADLIDEQKSSSYWEESNNRKFYDTALALLSLQTTNSDAKDNAINYLFEEQDASGCWGANNLLETSFLLYAIAPKSPHVGSGPVSDCSDSGFFCISSGSCISSDTYDGYYCPRIGDSCCAQGLDLESCSEKNGIICQNNQRCSETEVIAEDTNCCTGDCEIILEENDCEQNGYTCKSTCSDSQEERTSYSSDCDYGDKCCAQKPPKSGSGWLIFLLILLIILVVLAIIFRNQLKIWFFKIKSKFKSGKGPKSSRRPPTPPSSGIPQFNRRPRQIIPRQPRRRMPARRVPRKPRRSEDGAFEETMKKLRDMTK
jgi:hypothetical protein